MTPSNQHSDEAIGAIIAEARANVASAAFGATPNQAEKILRGEVADDRIRLLVSMADALEELVAGRESKQHTDVILAAPSLSLVAARRDFAEKASAHMRANGHGFTRRIDMELLYDALFASGILKPSSEVEAAALEAAVEGASGTAAEAIRARAARVRSGKDEA